MEIQTDPGSPAEIDVLVALMPEPEAGVEREFLMDREGLAGERTGDDEEQRAEENVDA